MNRGINNKILTTGITMEYDSPWKEALEQYFESFMELFFPKIHSEVDWSKGYEFLDK